MLAKFWFQLWTLAEPASCGTSRGVSKCESIALIMLPQQHPAETALQNLLLKYEQGARSASFYSRTDFGYFENGQKTIFSFGSWSLLKVALNQLLEIKNAGTAKRYWIIAASIDEVNRWHIISLSSARLPNVSMSVLSDSALLTTTFSKVFRLSFLFKHKSSVFHCFWHSLREFRQVFAFLPILSAPKKQYLFFQKNSLFLVFVQFATIFCMWRVAEAHHLLSFSLRLGMLRRCK